MARFFIGILILVLVGSAVVAGVWYFGERTIETGNLARQVPAPVAWIQEPITITTRINFLPYSSCTQGTTPVDMVVLIDISASMVGAPIEQAAAGAQRLLDTLEFSKDQVAVALFNSDVVGRVGLTEDRQALTSLLRGAIANDGTNLMAALNYAQSELVSLRRRYDALPVVLLFSDGGDVNESGVAGLAQQIKQNGAQVFVIGLQGEDFNQPLLTAVASDTDSLRIAPSPQDLVAMFEAIAQTVNRYAISNFDYREPIATDNFAIVASTLSAGATVAGNDLRLHADVLTQEETQTLGGIQYQLIPQQYGYHAVTSDNALMALTTCEAERVQHSLPPGPSILVLPPMPFTFGFPLLLLLLAGLPLLFRRQKQSATPARGGSSGIGHTQPAKPLPLESFTHWLDRSDSLDPEAGRNLAASMTTTPTLIVGLGATGKTVLAQISRNLSERLGTQWPQNIRLLQISLPEKLEKGGAEPLPDQVTAVVLERDTTRLNLAQPHLRWAKQYADGVRQRGRLALFADLSDGKVNSFLWQAMDRAIGDQVGVVVWIVTDAFSPASGMIVDVAHLLHVRARADILASMRLCLAMQNTHWPGGTNTHILAKRAFATIRELRRVRRVRGAQFTYAPNLGQQELDDTNTARMFDDLYLFDGHGENANNAPYDITALPPADGVLRVISNSLLALLEQSLAQEFYQRDRNTQTALARAGEANREDYGSSMGCATVRTPLVPTRRLAELRLAHLALLDFRDGLFGWGKLTRDGTSSQSPVNAPPISESDMNDLLQYTGLAKGVAPTSDNAVQHLADFLSDRMNNGAPMRLRWAIALLERARSNNYTTQILDDAYDQLQSWAALVGNTSPPNAGPAATRSGAPAWLNLGTESAAGTRPAETGQTQPTLVALWQKRWDETRDSFPKPGSNAPEQVVWQIKDEPGIFERYFPDPANLARRLRQRTYWLWSTSPGTSPGLELRLLVLPDLLSAPEIPGGRATHAEILRKTPYRYALTPREASQLLERLLSAATAFSRVLDQEVVSLYLQNRVLQDQLTHNASPLFARVEINSERVAPVTFRYLLAPPGASLQPADVNASILCAGSDPSCCMLLHAQQLVRIDNMSAVLEAKNSYGGDPSLHVFEVEQLAVTRENAATPYGSQQHSRILTLSSAAAAMLERSSAEFDQLGRLIVSDAIKLHHSADGWQVESNVPEFRQLAGLPLAGLLDHYQQLIGANVQVRTAVEQQLTNYTLDSDRRSKLQMQIDELVLTSDTAAHDIAICVAWALKDLT